jgi:hypothetical protein
MKTIQSMIAAVGLTLVLPASANAATTDPEVLIYRFPGVRDDGGAANAGVATVFNCTNFSGATENVRFVTRGINGNLTTNFFQPIAHLATLAASTHPAFAYFGGTLNLGTGLIEHGTTAIAATSINVICTAMVIDASTAAPIGVALRGIRFSLVPGSQE